MGADGGLFDGQQPWHACACAVCGRLGVKVEIGKKYFGFKIESRHAALNRSAVESSQRGWGGYYAKYVHLPNQVGGGRYTGWRQLCPACRHWRPWLERQGHRAGLREYNRRHTHKHTSPFYGGY